MKAKKIRNGLMSYGEVVYELFPPLRDVNYILLSVMSGTRRIDVYQCQASGTLTNMNAFTSFYEMKDHKEALMKLGYELEE